MKISIFASIVACGLVTNVAAITKRRGTRRGQVERLLDSKKNNGVNGISKKSKKGSAQGGDYFFLALPCVPEGFLRKQVTNELSCLTYTDGEGFDKRVSDEIKYDGSIGARCCGSPSSPVEAQQWRFIKVNEFFALIQNKGSQLCLRAPTGCDVGSKETEDGVFNGSYPGAGKCNADNDLYLWSVSALKLTSKACSTEGSISRDLFFYGCTDGIVTIPGPNQFYNGPPGSSKNGGGGLIASKSAKSFGAKCSASVCSLDQFSSKVNNC